ncbi:hypothetical protein ACYSNR_17500 [Enterococcus sp. LJL128]|uniref:hypothetical protein n=1 Tax=Enterococcus sp. LJL51 TaxID=3416656 RepID=UPI003CF7DB02
MNFHEIRDTLTTQDPHSFLSAAKMFSEQEEDPFFLFQDNAEETFEENVNFLSSEETLSSEDLDYWKEHDFTIVCQTIDGDYIGGNTDETFVIPSSLYKLDIEIYPLFLADFFTAYEEGKIESNILPPHSPDNNKD